MIVYALFCMCTLEAQQMNILIIHYILDWYIHYLVYRIIKNSQRNFPELTLMP